MNESLQMHFKVAAGAYERREAARRSVQLPYIVSPILYPQII